MTAFNHPLSVSQIVAPFTYAMKLSPVDDINLVKSVSREASASAGSPFGNE